MPARIKKASGNNRRNRRRCFLKLQFQQIPSQNRLRSVQTTARPSKKVTA
jgi:hypothetical protein